MPRALFTAVSFLLLSIPFGSSHAHAATPANVRSVRVMVQLAGSPAAADPNLKDRSFTTHYRFRFDPGLATAVEYGKQLTAYQHQEIDYLRSQGVQLQVDRQFHLLYNGFAATVPTSQLDRLRSLTNVTAVTPEAKFVPLDDRSNALINAEQAWPVVGGGPNAGKGMYIADLDTGIDTSNPCFNDAGYKAPPFGRRSDTPDNYKLTNNKVVVVRAFGSYSTQQYSAADAEGHGTFTAAIEACDYNTPTPLGVKISGVAPAAYILAYDVFADTGQDQGNEDPVIAGLEAALQDGADVANLSLGSTLGAGDPRLDPWTQVVSQATKAGLVVVVSAGNAGPNLQSVSTPASAPDVIAVGASTNSRGVSQNVEIGGPVAPPDNLLNIRSSQGSHPFTSPVGPAQLVYVGLARLPGDDTDNPNANDLAGKDLHGKIALIQRGTLFFETKINNVAKAGAVGAIIFDNRYELNVFSMDVKSATLPAMSISQADGQALLKWLNAHPDATATLDPTKRTFEETPDILSDFSSQGYGPGYSIKPDLVAPGQDIYSATETQTPNNSMYDPSGFTVQMGTSFSAPHVTGAAALVLQAHPKWTPAQVKAALVETGSGVTTPQPGGSIGVMQVGGGMLNVSSAIAPPALLQPSTYSLGQVNLAYGPYTGALKLTLSDVGGGSGPWTVAVNPLHTAGGLTLAAPSTVNLPAGGTSAVTVNVSISSSAQPGDYDGYVVLTRGAQTLHVPYFVHVINKAVTPGTVLLVDDSTSRFVPDAGTPGVPHVDVTRWYTQTLDQLHMPYTYWDEAVYGSPSLQDMKRSSGVILFTGANLGGFDPANKNPQALLGPLTSIDVMSLHSYLDAGGRVFVTGEGAAISDLAWSLFVLGANIGSLSVYDTDQNDQHSKGGISPPKPSAVVDTRTDVKNLNPWMFSGMKQIDFSDTGDGAKDNGAVHNDTTADGLGMGLVGVPGLVPFSGTDQYFGTGYGRAVLRTADLKDAAGGPEVAIASSDDPTLTHKASYPGRAVLFSFGFEGINDNTGYATRAEVLSRIFAWFNDTPSVAVANGPYRSGVRVTLRAKLKSQARGGAVSYTWQVGKKTLKATKKPTTFTFPHPGKYTLRVQATDHYGHTAVSAPKTITVR